MLGYYLERLAVSFFMGCLRFLSLMKYCACVIDYAGSFAAYGTHSGHGGNKNHLMHKPILIPETGHFNLLTRGKASTWDQCGKVGRLESRY